jgi:hypothetical protein
MIIHYNVFRAINLMICIQKQVSSLKTTKFHPRRGAALKPRQCWISPRNTSLNLAEKLWMTFTLKFSLKARLKFCRKVFLALKEDKFIFNIFFCRLYALRTNPWTHWTWQSRLALETNDGTTGGKDFPLA